MKRIIYAILIVFSIIFIQSCRTPDLFQSRYNYRGNYIHRDRHHTYGNDDYYPHRGDQSRREPLPLRPPAKPSHHFAESGSPAKHKNRDVNWVRSQQPNDFTIEVTRGKNRAAVAQTLHHAPRNARKAQVGSRNGQYTGVYGSYKNREEANKALENLPSDIRQQARIKRWKKVQSDVKAPDDKVERVIPVAPPSSQRQSEQDKQSNNARWQGNQHASGATEKEDAVIID